MIGSAQSYLLPPELQARHVVDHVYCHSATLESWVISWNARLNFAACKHHASHYGVYGIAVYTWCNPNIQGLFSYNIAVVLCCDKYV